MYEYSFQIVFKLLVEVQTIEIPSIFHQNICPHIEIFCNYIHTKWVLKNYLKLNNNDN